MMEKLKRGRNKNKAIRIQINDKSINKQKNESNEM